MSRQLCTAQRWLMATAILLHGLAAPTPAGAQGPAKATAVFFAPLKLPRGLRRHELSLRRLLTARFLATGRFTAAVSAETERAVQECVRQVNKDRNAQQCWVRIGQGQGAEMLVTGDLMGDERACDLSVQLTVLETRVSPRMHVNHLEPCGARELRAEMTVAAAVLAGVRPPSGPVPAAAPGDGPTASLPPPPSDTSGRAAPSGLAPPPPAAAVGSLSVIGSPKGARVDVSGPSAFHGGEPLATSLPLFPPQTVPAGEYTVRVTAPEHVPFEQTRVVPALGTWAVEARLEPSTATLVVSGEPAGASTTIRCGPGLSRRPLNLPPGRDAFGLAKEEFAFKVPQGRCVVRASLVGWQSFEQEVTVAGGARKVVRVKLSQLPEGIAGGNGRRLSRPPSPAGAPRPSRSSPAQHETIQRLEEARRQAEAERIRMEAASSAEGGQRGAAPAAVAVARELKLGRALHDGRDYWGAAKAFQLALVRSPEPSSPAAHEASYGLGRALHAAGARFVAADTLVEVLLQGSDRAHFADAFSLLEEIRREIDYYPPSLESFAKLPIGDRPRGFQDRFHYLLGEFFHFHNSFAKARKHLALVSDGVPLLAAKARYREGLLLVEDSKYRSAVAMFERSVTAAATALRKAEGDLGFFSRVLGGRKDDPAVQAAQAVQDLGLLALARVAFDASSYRGARFYYDRVIDRLEKEDDPETHRTDLALRMEALWAAFMEDDPSFAARAAWFVRGTASGRGGLNPDLQAGGSYRPHSAPELPILVATHALNGGRFEEARAALTAFQQQYERLATPLRLFLAAHRTPRELYEGLRRTPDRKGASELPDVFLGAALADVEVRNLLQTVSTLEREIDLLGVQGGRLGSYGRDQLQRVQAQRQRTLTETGIRVHQVLKQAEAELGDLTIKSVELGLEIAADEARTVHGG